MFKNSLTSSLLSDDSRARNALRRVKQRWLAPAALRANHRSLSEPAQRELVKILSANYFTDPQYFPEPPGVYLQTAHGQQDLRDHHTGRLDNFRFGVVPWLNVTASLTGRRILEIGCGTGSSTVALAEQGAKVFGVDVSRNSLQVAQKRCELYGLSASFILGNAAELPSNLRDQEFDSIMFFAVLEHMTAPERCSALHSAWKILRPGQHLVVVETPNRLWHTDRHTSGLPFLNWLPDDVAFAYSRYSKRDGYNRRFGGEITDELSELFCRWGRGVSFHDFVIALGIEAEDLPVLTSLDLYRRRLPTLRYNLDPA